MIRMLRTLSGVRGLVEDNAEYCGYIRGDGTLSALSRGPSIADASRGMCKLPRSPVYFHTHPRMSFAIPSAEDVLHVVNRSYRMVSFVVTQWGIYVLTNTAPAACYKDGRLSPGAAQALLCRFQHAVDGAVRGTRVPRHLRNASGDKSGMPTQRKLERVKVLCEDVTRASEGMVHMAFVSWGAI